MRKGRFDNCDNRQLTPILRQHLRLFRIFVHTKWFRNIGRREKSWAIESTATWQHTDEHANRPPSQQPISKASHSATDRDVTMHCAHLDNTIAHISENALFRLAQALAIS
jgi:hypothetical protein